MEVFGIASHTVANDLPECHQNDQASIWQNIPDYDCLSGKPLVKTV
jgi:hypothetical protein